MIHFIAIIDETDGELHALRDEVGELIMGDYDELSPLCDALALQLPEMFYCEVTASLQYDSE